MEDRSYNINSIKDVLKRVKLPRFKEFVQCWDAATKSSKKSKSVFLLQCINFSIAWLLILIVLPSCIDQATADFASLEYLFFPVGKVTLIIASLFTGVTIPAVFGLSWTTIFETGIRMTLYFMIGLILFVIWLFWGLIVDFKNRLMYDLSLWKTSE